MCYVTLPPIALISFTSSCINITLNLTQHFVMFQLYACLMTTAHPVNPSALLTSRHQTANEWPGHLQFSLCNFPQDASNWQHWCSNRYTAVHRRISQVDTSHHLRPVAISAGLAPPHASYRGPELVWATGRLMSPDRGFGTSCLLHCSHLTVSANSEDSWKHFYLSSTRLRRRVTLAFRRRI